MTANSPANSHINFPNYWWQEARDEYRVLMHSHCWEWASGPGVECLAENEFGDWTNIPRQATHKCRRCGLLVHERFPVWVKLRSCEDVYSEILAASVLES